MKVHKNKIKKRNNRKRIYSLLKDFIAENKVMFFLTVSVMFLCWISFIYWDMQSIASHSISAWDLLFKGDFLKFYSNSISLTVDGLSTPANYNMTLYIFFIIWNFPIWLIGEIFNFDPVESSICMTYSKLLLIVFLVYSAYWIYKICRILKISEKNSLFSAFFYITSAAVLSAVLVIGQSDVIVVTFTLIAVYKYLKNSKFYPLWFSLAISMKFYAVFIFIPLLLLREKRILRIILNTAISFSITILCKLPFIGDSEGMLEVNTFTGYMIDKLFANTVPLITGNLPIVIVFWVIISIICWLKPEDDFETANKYSIYIIFVTYMGVFLGFVFYPYWLLHLMPYFPIIIMLNFKNINKNLTIECVGFCSIIFSMMMRNLYSVCYDLTNISKSGLAHFGGRVDDLKVQLYYTEDMVERSNNLITAYNLERYSPWFSAVFVGCMIMLLYMNRPSTWSKKIDFNCLNKTYFRTRVCVNLLICCIPLLFYGLSIILSAL